MQTLQRANPAATVETSRVLTMALINAQIAEDGIASYDKAHAGLNGWGWVYMNGVLKIASATRPGLYHFASQDTCSCEAGQAERSCWHVVARWAVKQALKANGMRHEYGAYVSPRYL